MSGGLELGDSFLTLGARMNVVAWTSGFHCTTLGWTSTSRESFTSVSSPLSSGWTTPRLNSTVNDAPRD